MQLVEIIRNTVAGGKPVFVGDVLGLSERDTQTLITMGKAIPHVPKATPEVTKPRVKSLGIELAVKPPKTEKAVKQRGRPRGSK